MKDSIGPWFGFDTIKGKYEAVGSKDVKATYTALDDVGKVVAELAVMDPQSLPDEL
jgi:hypothetical protein